MWSFLSFLSMSDRRSDRRRGVRRARRRQSLGVEAVEGRQLLSGMPVPVHPSLSLHLDPILDKYMSLGGAGGILGKATSGEKATPYGGGLYETFKGGAIFYSASTGAHDVLSPTRDEFFATGKEKDAYGTVVEKLIGLPTSDQASFLGTSGGAITQLKGGVICWSQATGAHVVYGAIGGEYAATAHETDAGGRVVQTVLGLPTSDEVNDPYVSGARMNTFQGGAIYWSQATGAHVVYGAIGAEYAATAHQTDAGGRVVQTVLGLPTSDEMNVPGISGARMNTFQGGDIFWSSATGAHVVYGGIFGRFRSGGGAATFGLPTNDEAITPDGQGRFNHFARPGGGVAAIDWTPWTGAHAVTGAIAAEFAELGWEKIGEAVTDKVDIVNPSYTGTYNRFEVMTSFGSLGSPYSAIDWTKATGAYLTHGTQYSDIRQGDAGTCWIDASVAALENSGEDLSQCIQYEGNDQYAVSLYFFNDPSNPQAGMHPVTEQVYFDGTTYGADMQWDPSDPAQSWALIMQRAVLEAFGKSVQDPIGGGDAAVALEVLTGLTSQVVGVTDPSVQLAVESALNSGKAVVLGTSDTPKTLVPDHCYAVLGANSGGLELYNPWGSSVLVDWDVIAQDGTCFMIS
jgi:hypothetical protein